MSERKVFHEVTNEDIYLELKGQRKDITALKIQFYGLLAGITASIALVVRATL
jgi:hypothetical protein